VACLSTRTLLRRAAAVSGSIVGACILLSVIAMRERSDGFTVERVSNGERHSLQIRFKEPAARRLSIEFGPTFYNWYPPEYPADLEISVTDANENTVTRTHHSVPIVHVDASDRIRAVSISGKPANGKWTQGPVYVLNRLPLLW
jgi:hypothetical protein